MKNRITAFGIILAALGLAVAGCRIRSQETTRITTRPTAPTIKMESGEHPLGLGGLRLVNRDVIRRDGLLYIPRISEEGKPMPLLVWLHGGGGNCESYRYLFPMLKTSKL